MADPNALLAHTSWVRELAVRLVRDPDLAEDLTQQTYLAAIDHGRSRTIRAERAWLGTVLRNLVRETVRGQRRRRAREQRAARAEATPSTLESVAERAARRDVVDAVMALPERYRTVVVARYFEGELPTEIARRGGEPVATIKTRLQRGLGLLREQLEARHATANGGRGEWRAALLPLTGFLPNGSGGVSASATVVATPEPMRIGARWLVRAGAFAAVAVCCFGLAMAWDDRPREHRPSDRTSAQPRNFEVARDDGPARREIPPASLPSGLGAVSAAATERALDPRQRTVRGRVVDPLGRAVPGLVLTVGAESPLPAGSPTAFGLAGPAGPGARTREQASALKRRATTPRDAGGGVSIALSSADGSFAFRNVTSYGAIEVASDTHAVVLTTRAGRSAARTAVVVVAPLVTARGRVVDEDGRGLVDAVVSIEYPAGLRASLEFELEQVQTRRYAVFSDADGRFELPRAPIVDGAHWLVRREGFVPYREPLHREQWAQWTVRMARAQPAAQSWHGEVFDSAGRPVPDARVSDGVTVTRSDARGRFWLPRREQAARIRAVVPGWRSGVAALPAPSGDSVRIELPGRSLTIDGVVVDAKDRPVPGASVWIVDPTCFCRARSIQHRGTEWHGLREDATTYFDLPLVVESIQASSPSSTWLRVTTDDHGRFQLVGLDARRYLVVAESANSAQSTGSVAVEAGASSVTLAMHERVGTSVRGVLQDRSGQPVQGAQVSLQRSRFALRVDGDAIFRHLDLGHCVLTGADGTFELFGLPPAGPWPDSALRVRGAGIRTTLVPIVDGLVDGVDVSPPHWIPGGVLRLPRWARVFVELAADQRTVSNAQIRFLDAAGDPVPLHRREGNMRRVEPAIAVPAGRTGWFDVPVHAVKLEVLIEGSVVHERLVQIRAQQDHRLRVRF